MRTNLHTRLISAVNFVSIGPWNVCFIDFSFSGPFLIDDYFKLSVMRNRHIGYALS